MSFGKKILFLIAITLLWLSGCTKPQSDVVYEELLDTTSPTVEITTPLSRAKYMPGLIVPIRANAQDKSGVLKVEFKAGKDTYTAYTSPWEWDWKVPKGIFGLISISATAYDRYNNKSTVFVEIFIN